MKLWEKCLICIFAHLQLTIGTLKQRNILIWFDLTYSTLLWSLFVKIFEIIDEILTIIYQLNLLGIRITNNRDF